MDDDAILGAANALGWDARKTLAAHHIDTAKTARELSFWRQLGAAAMVAAVALSALPMTSFAKPVTEPEQLQGIGIMRNARRWAKVALQRVTQLMTMPAHGSPALLA